MKLSGRYTAGLYAGVGGILFIVGINALSIPASLNAQMEQTKAETAKKVADAYAQNGIASPSNQLIINDYILSDTPPRIDWQNTVDPTEKVMVFDKNRLCIGYAHKGRFYFTKYYQGVCNDGTW
ncbi:MAG TPA: hypothetical protein V6C95_06490 [Coleofasciculaceae cyanobacterium]